MASSMLEPYWKRIGGLHLDDDGTLAAVWMAHDEQSSVVHIYDCALFRETMTPIIVNGITARGRYIPMAWRKQDQAIKIELEEEGIDMLPDPTEDNQASIARGLNLIKQFIGANRLRVDRRVKQWLDEYRMLSTDGIGNAPERGFPLISATRHALSNLNWAEAEYDSVPVTKNHPDVTVV